MRLILTVLFIIILVLINIRLVKIVRQNFNWNRWIVALVGPLFIILPLIFFENISAFLWIIFLFIFMFSNIYFFESTREMVEKGKIK